MTKPRPRRKLEYKLLFAIVVAGKTARHARAAMDRLEVALRSLSAERLWFAAILDIDTPRNLATVLRIARTGNYTKIERAFREVVNAGLNLHTCTIADLERIHGIGPKTARFWMLWTRPDVRCAALDTHVLRWLSQRGHENVPRSTPQNPKAYRYWEECFLNHATGRDLTPAQLDSKNLAGEQ